MNQPQRSKFSGGKLFPTQKGSKTGIEDQLHTTRAVSLIVHRSIMMCVASRRATRLHLLCSKIRIDQRYRQGHNILMSDTASIRHHFGAFLSANQLLIKSRLPATLRPNDFSKPGLAVSDWTLNYGASSKLSFIFRSTITYRCGRKVSFLHEDVGILCALGGKERAELRKSL